MRNMFFCASESGTWDHVETIKEVDARVGSWIIAVSLIGHHAGGISVRSIERWELAVSQQAAVHLTLFMLSTRYLV
jgi:hypothetical protein